MVEYGVYGYQNIEDENKKTNHYLINYFNKKQKNLNKKIVQYCYFLIFFKNITKAINKTKCEKEMSSKCSDNYTYNM